MPILTGKERFAFGSWGIRLVKAGKAKTIKVPTKDKELLTLSEVAELLSVSRSTVTGLITIKRRQTAPLLRTVMIGAAVRVTRNDLNNYILAKRISSGISTLTN